MKLSVYLGEKLPGHLPFFEGQLPEGDVKKRISPPPSPIA